MVRSSLELIRRFPYMFDGEHADRSLFRGWSMPFEDACLQVDQLLPGEKLGFHWVQLGERDGAGWFVYALNERKSFVLEVDRDTRRATTLVASAAPDDLCSRIDGVVLQAELATARLCIACGRSCDPRRYFGRQLPLCTEHNPEAVNEQGEEGLEGVWRVSVEWEGE